jgi:aryl-alcohol dehydrogenase-like predicted oxidoreductase
MPENPASVPPLAGSAGSGSMEYVNLGGTGLRVSRVCLGMMSFGDTSLYSQPADFDVVDEVAQVAAERGVPPAQVALAWLVHRPGVTAPIVGATKVNHLSDALASVGVKLSDDEIKRLEERYIPHPVLGHS